jgi:methylmalonyl-CoA mutase N-terminal domain/subunit
VLYIGESAAQRQLESLERVRSTRDRGQVARTLDRLKVAASGAENLMPPILEAARAYATVGEMCDVLRDVWGEYEEIPAI